MKKRALLFPLETKENLIRVLEVAEKDFPVTDPLFWLDCDESVTGRHWFDPETGKFVIKEEPLDLSKYNKETAIRLLKDTDWSELSDVSNTNNNPHLTNKNEFVAYRLELRKIVVDPPVNVIEWPVRPKAQWK